MADTPLEKLRRTCLGFAGAYETTSHGSPTFWAGKRTFAAFAAPENHHGRGRPAVWCKSDHLTQSLLIARDPGRYFVPAYVGPSGWVGIYLDKRPRWAEVAERLAAAHRLVAPKSGYAGSDGPDRHQRPARTAARRPRVARGGRR